MARLLCACFHTSRDAEVIPLSRTVEESAIHQLPADAISRISQFLEVTDVLSLSHTCSFLYSCVTQDNRLWKRHCQDHFMVDELPTGGRRGWYTQWLHLCREFGRYRFCYAQVKSAWKQIESFLQQHCPQAYSNLMASGGASEEELDKLERSLQVQLPDDYRCSLRHHGKLSVLLGSVDHLQVLKHPAEATHVNHQTFKLKAVRDVQFESIRPKNYDVRVYFLAIGENFSSHPGTSIYSHRSFFSNPAETAKELLLMVSSDEGAVLTGYPIGHVFTAFSSPIKYGFCQPGGCCPDENRLYEWLLMPESSSFAD